MTQSAIGTQEYLLFKRFQHKILFFYLFN
jgi:hypothetical protein